MTRVEFPQFELVGPKCATPGCKGVMVDHLSLQTKEWFQRCSACGGEANRVPAQEKLSWARRVINRVFKGERLS